MNPVVDGTSIRISIPALTQERRIDLTKMVDKKVEAGKVLLREERQKNKKEIDAEKAMPEFRRMIFLNRLKSWIRKQKNGKLKLMI